MEPSRQWPRLLSEEWVPILSESLQAFMHVADDERALAVRVAERVSRSLTAACAVGFLKGAQAPSWSASACIWNGHAPDDAAQHLPHRDDLVILRTLQVGQSLLTPSSGAAAVGLGPDASSSFGRQTSSLASLPLMSNGEILGVILVARTHAADPLLDERDLQLGQHFAELAAVALHHGRALASARRELAHEASRLKSELLINISHELRTPLNAIIGFSSLLHSGKAGPISETQTEYLGDILTSSRHLLHLINDALDPPKVEAGSSTAGRGS